VSVAWSDAVGKTKVTLKNGSDFGVIGFDEAVMNSSVPPSPVGPVPIPLANGIGQLSLPQGGGTVAARPNSPRTAGSVASPSNPSNTPASPPPIRRVIRTIPSAP